MKAKISLLILLVMTSSFPPAAVARVRAQREYGGKRTPPARSQCQPWRLFVKQVAISAESSRSDSSRLQMCLQV